MDRGPKPAFCCQILPAVWRGRPWSSERSLETVRVITQRVPRVRVGWPPSAFLLLFLHLLFFFPACWQLLGHTWLASDPLSHLTWLCLTPSASPGSSFWAPQLPGVIPELEKHFETVLHVQRGKLESSEFLEVPQTVPTFTLGRGIGSRVLSLVPYPAPPRAASVQEEPRGILSRLLGVAPSSAGSIVIYLSVCVYV